MDGTVQRCHKGYHTEGMNETTLELDERDALIVVDVQYDFCPGGALAVPRGDRVVPVLNRLIPLFERGGARVYASRDWHPADHVSFQGRGGPWPPHCIQGSEGAEIRRDLKLPAKTLVVDKGTDPERDAYSAFSGTGLARKLRQAGITRVWVGGLALDYCVAETALDASREGFEVHLLREATQPVEVQPGDGERAVERLRLAGVQVH